MPDESFEKEFVIPPSACDEDGKCRLPFLLRCMEQTAFADVERLGQGQEYLLQTYNVCWMLLSSEMTVFSSMYAGEHLTVHTRYCGLKGAAPEREYSVFSGGRQTAYAVQLWVVVDRTARTLRNPAHIPELNTCRAPCRPTARPAAGCGALKCVGSGEVGAKDIDFNGHMNNVRYVERALPYLPNDLLSGAYRLLLFYRHELLEGQRFDCLISDEATPFQLAFRSAERDCFRMQLLPS